MGKVIDLTGQTFERLSVLYFIGLDDKRKQALWFCKCICGKTKIIQSNNLIRGVTKSCGCLQKEKAGKKSVIDLTGKVFGRWTVLKCTGYTDTKGIKRIKWLCRCTCGVEKHVVGHNLTIGESKSCGCARNEKTSLLNRKGAMAHNWRGGIIKSEDGIYTYLNQII
jgi:hypothetical protein